MIVRNIGKIVVEFNERLAARATMLMSTMMCVYIFTIWSLIPLVARDTQALVFYVSGGILQLVCLPLIMVGQSVLNRKSEIRAEQDHLALMEAISDLQVLLVEEAKIVKDEDEEVSDLADVCLRLERLEALLTSRQSP